MNREVRERLEFIAKQPYATGILPTEDAKELLHLIVQLDMLKAVIQGQLDVFRAAEGLLREVGIE